MNQGKHSHRRIRDTIKSVTTTARGRAIRQWIARIDCETHDTIWTAIVAGAKHDIGNVVADNDQIRVIDYGTEGGWGEIAWSGKLTDLPSALGQLVDAKIAGAVSLRLAFIAMNADGHKKDTTRSQGHDL